jgi:large subunit ribosomal protein L32e
MPDDEPAAKPAAEPKPRARKKPAAKPTAKPASTPAPAEEKKEAPEEVRAPKRGDLSVDRRRLLALRRVQRRPIFGRQAANRYWRIGRDGAWRRPRGLQSKQRRHYGYRAQVVSIGYRSPAAVRGLAPNGFRPVIVHTLKALDSLDPAREAAVIARTVGTRRRLTLEDAARQKGIHVLNPIVTSERET